MASSGQTILIVEDDSEILEEIAGFLRRRNFNVVTAPNLHDGSQALSNGLVNPNVLLTDVNLPDGNGLELLDQINQAAAPPAKPRVIVMTGHLDASCVQKAKDDGAESVLLKPFSLGKLLGHLRPAAA